MSPHQASLLRWLRLGAQIVVNRRSAAEWRRVLEQRERNREQREWDELERRLDPDRDRW